ncbi:hypothetical protein PSQ19_05620 [Devosia algicola]|uniref:Uncharacterized protein n=1 Tax=Devosia algicola TaxID=3026418 RepID=A0ABY7YQU2_9HYPH|nr:hypothetical protein [Devosia algicola]WDR03567.1 hypothetical protein PSQ19_05620 [Devosia algicola]
MTFMLDQKQLKQLKDIVDKLLGRDEALVNALARFTPPFDISRPNIHDSKKEFSQELAMVEAIFNHLAGAVDQLLPNKDQETAEFKVLRERIRDAIEIGAVQKFRNMALNQPRDLALKNMSDTGFFMNSMRIIIDLGSGLID